MTNRSFFYNDIDFESGYSIFIGTGTRRCGDATGWYVNYLLHREDGPAVEWKTGRKEWYQYDKRHRENGPAVEREDGGKSYYFCDVLYSREEYLKLLKLDSL